MKIKIIALAIFAVVCLNSCGDTTATYCTAQKDLLQIDNTAPVIPLNFEYSTQAMENTITAGFNDLDSICGRSPVFLVPFHFNTNEIKATPNAILLSFSAISYCASDPIGLSNKSRYDLSILGNKHNQLMMRGEAISRFEFTEQLEKWYFEVPEEQEATMKRTRFSFIYNITEETIPQDSLIQVFHSLTESYLKIAEQVAQKTYKRPICKLSAVEIKGLKEKFPFHISLRLKQLPVPPPPIQ